MRGAGMDEPEQTFTERVGCAGHECASFCLSVTGRVSIRVVATLARHAFAQARKPPLEKRPALAASVRFRIEGHDFKPIVPSSRFILGCFVPLAQNQPQQDKLKALKQEESADYFQKWLNEEALYLITDEERAVFNKLTTAEEKEQFIEQFWYRRDPDIRTAVNEFKEEHYRRIAYANEWYGSGDARLEDRPGPDLHHPRAPGRSGAPPGRRPLRPAPGRGRGYNHGLSFREMVVSPHGRPGRRRAGVR